MVSHFTPVVAAAAVAFLLAPESVHAHSSMSAPKPTFPEGFYLPMSPFARINGETFTGAASVASYMGPKKIAAAMSSTNAKTLREFVMTNMNITMTDQPVQPTKECGMSQASGTRQELTDTVEWGWAHPGPCEIWCDNTRLFFNADCSGNSVGNVKIDKSKCAGASFLQGMYVGTHVPNWEVYVNCVPLVGGTSTDAAAVLTTDAAAGSVGGETGADGDGGAAASPAPATSTTAPAAAPATTTTPSAPSTTTPPSAPEPTPGAAPASTPAATSAPTPKKNCTKRLRV